MHDESESNHLCREKLFSEVRERLNSRLHQQVDLSIEEVTEVSRLSRRLFPVGYLLDEEKTSAFRSLCNLSQLALRPATEIRSHRKLLGPLIVFVKKLSWPIIGVHLKRTFEHLQEFASWTVVLQAKQQVELAEIRAQYQQRS